MTVELLTAPAVARLRGCDPKTVRAAMRDGTLRSRLYPYLGVRLVKLEDAEAWQPRGVGRPARRKT